MKHQLSDDRIEYLARPFGHTGRFWGAALVACIVAPYGFWKLLPLTGEQLAVLATYLVAAACISLLVVVVRRFLRRPRHLLKSIVIDVTATGVWQETFGSRTLLMQGAQLRNAHLFRNSRNELARVLLEGGGKQVEVAGLVDMDAFLTDLRAAYRGLRVVENATA